MSISTELVRNSDITTRNNQTVFLYSKELRSERQLPLAGSQLFIKHGKNGRELLVYEVSKRQIFDFSVVQQYGAPQDDSVKVIWRERAASQVYSELHVAEITPSGDMTMHQVIESEATQKKFILPLAYHVSNHLVIVQINEETRQCEARVVDLDNSSRATVTVIDEQLSSDYFTQKQNYLANLTITPYAEGKVYLLMALSNGSIQCYSLEWESGASALMAEKLFVIGADNMGFHRTCLDENNKRLLLVCSQKKNAGDISVISQPVFISRQKALARSTSYPVNQSKGSYLRPDIIDTGRGYAVVWEGSRVHYTMLDYDFNISVSEETIEIDKPGNCLVNGNGDEYFVSYQENTLSSKLQGDRFGFSPLTF